MKKIIPVTDLQRQAGQILSSLSDSDEPVIVTQRGRVAAVLISAGRYSQIEDDFQRLDDLELAEMVKQAREARKSDETISHNEVKKRIGPASSAGGRPSRRER